LAQISQGSQFEDRGSAAARASSKLSDEDVVFIKSHREMTAVSLGKMFNVADATISNIRKGRTWKEINEEVVSDE
jgi:hypothetical protein